MTTEVQIEKTTKVALNPPRKWKVLFLNDDQTPMQFVIELLTTIFRHDLQTAEELTMEIHNTGSAVVGLYTHEVAEQKGIDATSLARENGFPLQVTIEEDK